jgi:PHS family inorganic phosphate transporter-like MFS transporter
MLAAVFLMQSLGQLAAYSLGLLVLVLVAKTRGLDPNETRYEVASPVIDQVWRIAIGIGAAPALVAIGLRRIIPETPLWLATHRAVGDAADALGAIYPYPSDEEFDRPEARGGRRYSQDPDGEERTLVQRVVAYFIGLRKYLAENDRWRALAGVCIVWFLLDV